MTDAAPERIWFAPDEGCTDRHGWAGVQSGKDRLYWETDSAHHPDDDGLPYVPETALTTAQARIAELEAALAEERNQVARYALRLVEIGEAILGPYDDAYRNSMVPENDE